MVRARASRYAAWREKKTLGTYKVCLDTAAFHMAQMGVALLFLSSLSPTLSFRPAVVAPGTAARGAVKSYSSYSSNGQIWGPEGTAGGLGEPAVAEDKPAATVPDGTLWAYTGRLRTEETNVRQEFGGDRVATFDLDPTTMTGITKPTGFWDPLGFSKVDDETLLWYKHSELKHGRVCMLAFTGWWLNELGIFFPNLDKSSAGSPLAAWEAISVRVQ